MKEQEAECLVHDIQGHLDGVIACREEDHPETQEGDRRATILSKRESIIEMTSKNTLLIPMDVLEEGMSDSSGGSDNGCDKDLEATITTMETQCGDDLHLA